MKYGVHTDLVEEVVKFTQSGLVLQPSKHKLPAGAGITCDFDQAQVMAWEMTYGQDEFLWTDIRQKEMREARSAVYTIPNFNGPKENISALLDIFADLLKNQLDLKHKIFLDDIVTDLHCCAFHRAVKGSELCFFEEIFEIYKAGAFPCGWIGNYPEGQICVYVPKRIDRKANQ